MDLEVIDESEMTAMIPMSIGYEHERTNLQMMNFNT